MLEEQRHFRGQGDARLDTEDWKASTHRLKHLFYSQELLPDSTFCQDLWDFGVAGTEGAVELEAIGVIKERAPQRKQHFLWNQSQNFMSYKQFQCLL